MMWATEAARERVPSAQDMPPNPWSILADIVDESKPEGLLAVYKIG